MTKIMRALTIAGCVASCVGVAVSIADASIMVPKDRWGEVRLEVREAAKSLKRSFDAHAFKWDVSVHGKELTCVYLATGPGMPGINHWILSLPKGRQNDGAKPSFQRPPDSGLLAQSDYAADRARSGRGPSDAGLDENFSLTAEFAKSSSGAGGGGGRGGPTGSPQLLDGAPLDIGGITGGGGPTVEPVMSLPAVGGSASSNEQALSVSSAPEPASLLVWLLLVGLAAVRRSHR